MPTALEVEDLHYRYPDGTVALRGVSFMIDAGSCVGIIGPNGSGKSTLLQHLNGLLPEAIDDQQPIKVMDAAIGPDNLIEVRREAALLFQNTEDQLFCPTVYEDIAYGPRQLGYSEHTVAEKVASAIRQVGLDGLENRPPYRLSAGQRRRVALAGILACEPKILLLDEPADDLDPAGRRRLIDLLQSLQLTRVLASNDLNLVAELCDQAILLDEGRIVRIGPVREILTNTELLGQHGLEVPLALRSSL